jgi:hypothetical protein
MAVRVTKRLSRIGLGHQAACLHGSLDWLENANVSRWADGRMEDDNGAGISSHYERHGGDLRGV